MYKCVRLHMLQLMLFDYIKAELFLPQQMLSSDKEKWENA